MNITFLIGNGFDINLGLKTRYEHFYPYFIEKAKKDNMIRNWIDGDERLWADLEEKLGKELIKVTDDVRDKFYDDKDELDGLLIEYLEKEQTRFSLEEQEKIKTEFTRSMINFYSELSINDVASVRSTLEKYKNEEYVYTYITFNYTDILDRIIGLYNEKEKSISIHQGNGGSRNNRLGKIIHIHGTTEEEMILGVNDVGQIDNDLLKDDEIFLDTFIKRRMNNSIGQRKTESAIEVINQSHIICVFGMSIGNTDKMWWEELIKWLMVSENNKLIIFLKGYEDALKKKLPSAIIRLNEKNRRIIFEKGKGKYDDSSYQKIKDRIMISYNASIFSFPRVQEVKD